MKTNIREQIEKHIRGLSADTVKDLVLQWIRTSDGTFTDFEQQLLEIQDNSYDDYAWGEMDSNLSFTPLTEAEQIQKSREALEDYQQTGQGIPQSQMQQWAESLGTPTEQLCSK